MTEKKGTEDALPNDGVEARDTGAAAVAVKMNRIPSGREGVTRHLPLVELAVKMRVKATKERKHPKLTSLMCGGGDQPVGRRG